MMSASRKLSYLSKRGVRALLNSPYFLGLLTGICGSFIMFLAHLYITRERDLIFTPIPITNRTVLNGPRVLCMISTHPGNYRTKAVHIQATWAGRCDKTVYLSSKQGGLSVQNYPDMHVAKLPIIEVEAGPRREDLWERIKLGLVRVWEQHRGEFDFLLKADDDTFVVMENLKRALQDVDPKTKVLFGHEQENFDVKYMSGGSGYIISSAGVESIVEVGLNRSLVPKAVSNDGYSSLCDFPHPYQTELDSASEDVQLGACAKHLGFQLIASDAATGQSSFFPFSLEHHVIPDLPFSWWVKHTRECKPQLDSKVGCASSYPISFHYVSPTDLYSLEYLLYTATVDKHS